MRTPIIHEAWNYASLSQWQRTPVARLRDWQLQQLVAFHSVGFPHRKVENWKYTNIAPIAKQAFGIAETKIVENVDHLKIEHAHAIVFVNGYFCKALSHLPMGVELSDINNDENLMIEKNYQTPFSLINDGLFSNAWCLRIAKGLILEQPIQLIYVTDKAAAQTMSHPRLLVCIEENAYAVMVEEYVGDDETVYFNNVVNQVEVKANAHLQWYKLQREGCSGFHVANTIIQQHADSIVKHYSIAIGGVLARDDLNYELVGKNAQCELMGFYHLKNNQLIDHHTRVDHKASHCLSRQNYKGIVDDQAKAVFNGKIKVHEKAEKTQAYQTNKNILMAKTAEVNTKPELEIYADDVKCTHGATVGQLDEEALFYLRSRGVEKSLAEKMLTMAFSSEIIEAIPHKGIAEKIKTYLSSHYGNE